jgi:hypothetical protein
MPASRNVWYAASVDIRPNPRRMMIPRLVSSVVSLDFRPAPLRRLVPGVCGFGGLSFMLASCCIAANRRSPTRDTAPPSVHPCQWCNIV